MGDGQLRAGAVGAARLPGDAAPDVQPVGRIDRAGREQAGDGFPAEQPPPIHCALPGQQYADGQPVFQARFQPGEIARASPFPFQPKGRRAIAQGLPEPLAEIVGVAQPPGRQGIFQRGAENLRVDIAVIELGAGRLRLSVAQSRFPDAGGKGQVQPLGRGGVEGMMLQAAGMRQQLPQADPAAGLIGPGVDVAAGRIVQAADDAVLNGGQQRQGQDGLVHGVGRRGDGWPEPFAELAGHQLAGMPDHQPPALMAVRVVQGFLQGLGRREGRRVARPAGGRPGARHPLFRLAPAQLRDARALGQGGQIAGQNRIAARRRRRFRWRR